MKFEKHEQLGDSRGYTSHSHQAVIAFLEVLEFDPDKITSVDRLRKQRNGIKYYGEDVSIEQEENALEVASRLIPGIAEKVKR